MQRPNGRREHGSSAKLEEKIGVAESNGMSGMDEKRGGARQRLIAPTRDFDFSVNGGKPLKGSQARV